MNFKKQVQEYTVICAVIIKTIYKHGHRHAHARIHTSAHRILLCKRIVCLSRYLIKNLATVVALKRYWIIQEQG